MNEYGFFWNSRGGDRRYNAESMSDWLRKFFTTGIFNGDFQVTAAGGMEVSVGSGYANIDGKVYMLAEPKSFTLATAYSSVTRVDTIVIERNDQDRSFYVNLIKGSTSGEPTPPVREDGVYQLVLAQITVDAGAVQITQADITDTRTSSTLCGWVAATVDQIDFDQIYAQFTTWFNAYKEEIIADFSEAGEMAQEIFNSWFQHMRGQLDTDAAGHLQLELDTLADTIAEVYSVAKLYNVGDYCTYENKLYKCTRAVTSYSSFNPNYWTFVRAIDMVSGAVEIAEDLKFTEDAGENCTTEFNQDGSITQTYSDRIKNTVFNSDGSITETLTNLSSVAYARKTTVFNADGSITETVTRV